MTSALTVPEETTWVSDFGPIPYEALDLASKPYEVRNYWLADFRLKAIGEALGFAAKFESPEVFNAYLDIKGDEGYIYFEIKANTRPMTLSLRYSAERWSAVDGRGAHTTLTNSYSETAVKSRGVLTVFHAFLDKELLAKVCEQLEITAETQERLLTRINFKEKTFSLVASEDATSDFPSQKPYKTSIIPTSPKAGESMNAQEETAEATQTQTASAEPSATETAASDSNATANEDVTSTDIARAEILAWATSTETPEHTAEPSTIEVKPEASVENAVEATVPAESPAVETAPVEAATPEVEAPAPAPAAAIEAAVEVVAETPAQTPAQAEVATPALEPTPEPVEAAVETPAPEKTPTAAAVEPAAEAPVEKKTEMWKTPAEIRAEKSPSQQNAAKNSDPGVLGKLAVKPNEEKSGNRDKKDNRENRDSNKDRDNARSNNSQARTNFAPQNNRSIEAPRAAESTPKYHTYSQSEVDSLIKKSADNVANSVTSKINKQTKVVEDTLKNQEFAFKQALEQINKQAEVANQKLDKAVSELTSASAKQKSDYKDSFEKEIEEFKSQINKKVNQGIKVIDSKVEQIEVKKPKQAPSPKSAPASGPSINPNVLFGILALVVLLTLGNIIISFNAFERISNLENAGKATTSTSTAGEVPIPDLMKDQINTTAPAPVQP